MRRRIGLVLTLMAFLTTTPALAQERDRWVLPPDGLALRTPASPAVSVAAGDPSSPLKWAFSRLAIGVSANAVVYEDLTTSTKTSGFLPQAYASWGATSRASLYGSAERDFAQDGTILSGGVALSMFGYNDPDRFQLGVSAEYVHYDGELWANLPEPDSWRAALKGSIVAIQTGPENDRKDVAYLALAVLYDPENSMRFWRGGLRANWNL